MPNANENRIDTSISNADQTAINTALDTVSTKLDPYTQSIIEEERTSLFSLAQENLVFTDDASEQAQLLLAKLSPEMLAIVNRIPTDLELHSQMKTLEEGRMAQLNQRIADTKRLAAHEAYVGALAFYKFCEAMAAVGVEGFQAAYDVLKVRFAAQGGRPAGGTNP